MSNYKIRTILLIFSISIVSCSNIEQSNDIYIPIVKISFDLPMYRDGTTNTDCQSFYYKMHIETCDEYHSYINVCHPCKYYKDGIDVIKK
jgi:hypothetical protein